VYCSELISLMTSLLFSLLLMLLFKVRDCKEFSKDALLKYVDL
jgi:hypothetical protein